MLGHEFAGEVVELGTRVTAVHKADRVAVLPVRSCGHCPACLVGRYARCSDKKISGGGFGQYALVEQPQCVRLPSSVSVADGALVEPLAVGLHGVNAGPMLPAARVLIIGAGPIGLAAAFWARRLGALQVTVTAPSDRRAALALGSGATAFVKASDDLAAQIKRVLGGPPDIVFEAASKPGLLAKAVELVRSQGTVVVAGLCTGTDTYNPFLTMVKEMQIYTSMLYDLNGFEMSVDVLNAGVVTPRSMVTETVPLSDLPTAFEALRHRTTQCKTPVDVCGG